jgi:hypothetical protein
MTPLQANRATIHIMKIEIKKGKLIKPLNVNKKTSNFFPINNNEKKKIK